MDMILRPADAQGFHAVLARDAPEVSPEAFLQWGPQPRFTILCAEDYVVVQAGEGVCHTKGWVSSIADPRTLIFERELWRVFPYSKQRTAENRPFSQIFV